MPGRSDCHSIGDQTVSGVIRSFLRHRYAGLRLIIFEIVGDAVDQRNGVRISVQLCVELQTEADIARGLKPAEGGVALVQIHGQHVPADAVGVSADGSGAVLIADGHVKGAGRSVQREPGWNRVCQRRGVGHLLSFALLEGKIQSEALAGRHRISAVLIRSQAGRRLPEKISKISGFVSFCRRSAAYGRFRGTDRGLRLNGFGCRRAAFAAFGFRLNGFGRRAAALGDFRIGRILSAALRFRSRAHGFRSGRNGFRRIRRRRADQPGALEQKRRGQNHDQNGSPYFCPFFLHFNMLSFLSGPVYFFIFNMNDRKLEVY